MKEENNPGEKWQLLNKASKNSTLLLIIHHIASWGTKGEKKGRKRRKNLWQLLLGEKRRCDKKGLIDSFNSLTVHPSSSSL
jgi:hypothetical protein